MLRVGADRAMSGDVIDQIATLARRSTMRTLRQPQAMMPATLAPIMILVVFSSAAKRAQYIPDFPARAYLDFMLAGAFVFGGLAVGLNSGGDLALDLESGFLNRMSLTKVSRPVLIIGHLLGSLAVGVMQGVVFLAIGLSLGVRLETGVLGAAAVIALSLLANLACASFGAFLGLRTGSAQVVQGLFPLFFVLLIFSSFLLPRSLMTVDWFEAMATANPLTYLLEGVRSPITTGWDGRSITLALVIGFAIAIVFIAASAATMRTRMVRR